MHSIAIGTSGWSYKDWDGVFYPKGASSSVYLSHYAERFGIVEVDSTYYRIPSARMVSGWTQKTPDTFRFAVKTPSVITHEKVLVDCDPERDEFLQALQPLDHKLHSILLQFGYFNKNKFANPGLFFDRLDDFLHRFPLPRQVAVEIRNKSWLCDTFFQLLKGHGVSYALTEHVWMPPVERVLDSFDCVTGDFVYLRLIGDRKGIEELSTTWDKTVIDRKARIASIVKALAGIVPQADIVVFINNHFAGHSPASCAEFVAAMEAEGIALENQK